MHLVFSWSIPNFLICPQHIFSRGPSNLWLRQRGKLDLFPTRLQNWVPYVRFYPKGDESYKMTGFSLLLRFSLFCLTPPFLLLCFARASPVIPSPPPQFLCPGIQVLLTQTTCGLDSGKMFFPWWFHDIRHSWLPLPFLLSIFLWAFYFSKCWEIMFSELASLLFRLVSLSPEELTLLMVLNTTCILMIPNFVSQA